MTTKKLVLARTVLTELTPETMRGIVGGSQDLCPLLQDVKDFVMGLTFTDPRACEPSYDPRACERTTRCNPIT